MGWLILLLRHLLLATCISCIVSASILSPRAASSTSCNLNVQSNDGGRKIAFLIDSSSSMYLTDPQNARLQAADDLTQWLVSDSEVTTKKTADEVAVISFNDTARLVYPLGDPAGASNAINLIQAQGGTEIVTAVDLGIAELTKDGSGTTAGRSSMIVFTDGEDYDTKELANAINNATNAGIRVSFGFMNTDPLALQNSNVLSAIKNSGGVYATITSSNSSSNFINYAIVNGLTNDDNPSGNNNELLAGLSTTHYITGINTTNISYNSQNNEWVQFVITSINAGALTASASYNGKVMNTTVTGTNSTAPGAMHVVTPTAGQINITISSTTANITNGIFLVSASSNRPITDCTVDVLDEEKHGWSKTQKLGVFVGVPAGVVAILAALFFGCLARRGGHGQWSESRCTTAGGDHIPATPPAHFGGYGFLSEKQRMKDLRGGSVRSKGSAMVQTLELTSQNRSQVQLSRSPVATAPATPTTSTPQIDTAQVDTPLIDAPTEPERAHSSEDDGRGRRR